MALINCPECAREISNKAAACPQCGVPIAPQDVAVKSVDPFAHYHTPIKGKAKGRITVIGFIGMLLVGPLMIVVGIATAREGNPQALSMLFAGFGMTIGCYLWARRPL